ncbi:unnamed protein product [Adineta steineri]|uniref:DUF2252 domain-containing protein n=1 Tax=Adineta steineri TaxID=433720 RepID=A0A815LUD9_9BILA|nr:unnamed protein product [Adineta steineri]CAF1361501.1 unnamed protein product [Adineta steineri]CAF1412409.1 unnamed protein product [Adineta steineri]CAF1600321.1 unnamed protein product [Adineta steineri]
MFSNLSFECDAPEKAIDRIKAQTDEERSQFIIDTFVQYLGDGIQDNPTAFRGRFRKMAATPFNFYRGSALLFYQDLKIDQDPWINGHIEAGNIFIHGDLHAENFGTYLDNHGILNFDVNDFDEGYCGPFTWDIKRLLASLNLVAHSKGCSDIEIEQILRTCVESYLKQVDEFCQQPDNIFLLTLTNTTGKIKKILNETRIKSHVEHLNSMTVIEDYDRRFIRSKTIKDVDDDLRADILEAFENYVKTIPEFKKKGDQNSENFSYHIKDIVSRSSSGIGSAGKVSYSILVEGPTQTLENDIILYMKPAQKSAISYVVQNDELENFFQHDGLRTVLCSYAMQAVTPQWLGYTSLRSIPCVVDEVTAHSQGLEWDDINDINDMFEVVTYLGQVTAKIHCVADSDCVNTPADVACLPFSIIPLHTEKTIREAIQDRDEEFINYMVEFGMEYGKQVRRYHHLFFEAFRNKLIPGLE